MATVISANYLSTDFPSNSSDWTLENKLNLFYDRILYWQLDIADAMINRRSENLKHSGFATLSVLFSYFEIIGKYLEGYVPIKDDSYSQKYFIIGFRYI